MIHAFDQRPNLPVNTDAGCVPAAVSSLYFPSNREGHGQDAVNNITGVETQAPGA
jgi:hypothetical protein